MRSSTSAFTLIELSLVILVLSLIAATTLRYASSTSQTNNQNATYDTLDVIETALMNYRLVNNRLPCPAAIGPGATSSTAYDSTEGGINFGVEEDTLGPASGTCTAYNSTDTLINNTGTDPDASGGTDPGAPDPLYDATTVGQVVAGGVPTKTLHIDDKYAYDSWGRKILYAVDIRATGNGAFTAFNVTNGQIGAIVVKQTAKDTLSNALTYKGIYALVSFGPNGHGGYARNPNNTNVIFSSGSTNSDELVNCHCTSAAAATTFYRIFVQKNKTPSSTPGAGFDDIVRFKTRSQMASQTELQ